MDVLEKYLNATLRFLSFRLRSEKEVKQFLTEKKVDPEIQDRILQSLYKNKLLDDERFAKWWIEQRTTFKPKGPQIIKMELRQKGISDEVISNELSSAEIKTVNSENIKTLIEKRVQRYTSLPPREAKQKLQQFLLRRGFDWDTIKQAIDDVVKKAV